MHLEMIEQQRQYWLKHPKEFIKDFTFFMITAKNNLDMKDRFKLEKYLQQKG